MRKYLVEFIGTFFLVLVIGLTGFPLAIGAMLMVMVYMGGHISGAHYNPAVSLAMIIRKKIGTTDALMYMLFQIAGAFAAAMFIFQGSFGEFVPAPNHEINVLKPLMVEAVLTFALVMVILNVATSKKTEGNSYYGLAIGFTIMAIATAGGPISGGAFNPAVGLGPILVDTINGGDSINHVWIYIAGPFLGAITASFTFRYINADEFETTT
ncbi:MAG: aquaporin [Bacteroidetes bacterium]|nr:aquaporin [Bacteroidota bacterium]